MNNMEEHSKAIKTAMDVYGCQHAASQLQTHQRTGSDSSESDTTPKAIPIPLPEAAYGQSRVGNNSWKNLGQLEHLGPNSMCGVLEAVVSQHVQTSKNASNSGPQTPENSTEPKEKVERKKVAWPVPTRKAPPPPARRPASLQTGNQGPGGNNELSITTKDSRKMKNGTTSANARQATN